MSIRVRLMIALGGLLLIAMSMMIGVLLYDAGRRVENEVHSSMHAIEELLGASIDAMNSDDEAVPKLQELLTHLEGLRHVAVRLYPVDDPEFDRAATPSGSSSTDGNVIQQTKILPVTVNGTIVANVVLKAQADDEMSEVWQTIKSIILDVALLLILALALTTWLINRSLTPISHISSALHNLEKGDYSAVVSEQGAPEFSVIARRVNSLSQALARSRKDNRRLSAAIVRAQDDERHDVARELHDEIGPHLFALRAHGAALKRAIANDDIDKAFIVSALESIEQQIMTLKATNRRVVRQLSPIFLQEIGLRKSIEAIVEMWRHQDLETAIKLEQIGDSANIDRSAALTIYRMVQEALTNAHRHANASGISISIDYAQGEDPATASARVTISDDGVGFSENADPGYGLTSMRERIKALGGLFRLTTNVGAGTILYAEIPLSVSNASNT